MRVLFVAGRWEIAEKQCLDAMMGRAFEVDVIRDPEFLSEERMRQKTYDFVFALFFDELVADLCHKISVTYLSLVLSLPEPGLYTKAAAYETNVFFVSDNGMAQKMQGWIKGAALYLPSGSIGMSVSDLSKRQEDGIGISSLAGTVSEWCLGYLHQTIRNQRILGGMNLMADVLGPEVVKEVMDAPILSEGKEKRIPNPVVEADFLASCVLAKEVERQQEERFFEFAGQRNWDLCKKAPRVYAIHDPVRDDGTGLLLVFANKAGYTGIEQAVYEQMEQGWMVLAEFREEIPQRFEIGTHLDIFVSEEDAKEKILFYMENREIRCRIAEQRRDHLGRIRFADCVEHMLGMIM